MYFSSQCPDSQQVHKFIFKTEFNIYFPFCLLSTHLILLVFQSPDLLAYLCEVGKGTGQLWYLTDLGSNPNSSLSGWVALGKLPPPL